MRDGAAQVVGSARVNVGRGEWAVRRGICERKKPGSGSSWLGREGLGHCHGLVRWSCLSCGGVPWWGLSASLVVPWIYLQERSAERLRALALWATWFYILRWQRGKMVNQIHRFESMGSKSARAVLLHVARQRAQLLAAATACCPRQLICCAARNRVLLAVQPLARTARALAPSPRSGERRMMLPAFRTALR